MLPEASVHRNDALMKLALEKPKFLKSDKAMKKSLSLIFTGCILILFIPIALLGALLPPNQYLEQGIQGVVDCDGPFGVMLFLIPGYLIYGAGAIVFSVFALREGNRFYKVAVVFCALMMALMVPNLVKTYREQKNASYQLQCDEGRKH